MKLDNDKLIMYQLGYMHKKNDEAIANARNGVKMMNHDKKKLKVLPKYNCKLLQDEMPIFVCHGTDAMGAYKICIDGKCGAEAKSSAGGPGVKFIGLGNEMTEETILEGWTRSQKFGGCQGGLIIAKLDGIVIATDEKTEDLPAGVIGTHVERWGKPREYVAHLTTIEFVAVVFETESLDCLLAPAMEAAKEYTPAMHKALQKCKEYLESPTVADSTATMVQLKNTLANSRPKRRPKSQRSPAQTKSQGRQQLPTGPRVIPVHYDSRYEYGPETWQWHSYSTAQQQPQHWQASAAASSSSGRAWWPKMWFEQNQIAENNSWAGPGPYELPEPPTVPHLNPPRRPAEVSRPIAAP